MSRPRSHETASPTRPARLLAQRDGRDLSRPVGAPPTGQDRHRRRPHATHVRRAGQAVKRVAYGLRAHGSSPAASSPASFPTGTNARCSFCAARLGAVVNPIPPTYRASELRFMLGLLDSRVVVIPEVFRGFNHAEMLRELRRRAADGGTRVRRPRRARSGHDILHRAHGSRWEVAKAGRRCQALTRIKSTRWCSPRAPRVSRRA